MKRVEVECYAGYRADERPVRLKLGEQTLNIEEVEDRWYSPGKRISECALLEATTTS